MAERRGNQSAVIRRLCEEACSLTPDAEIQQRRIGIFKDQFMDVFVTNLLIKNPALLQDPHALSSEFKSQKRFKVSRLIEEETEPWQVDAVAILDMSSFANFAQRRSEVLSLSAAHMTNYTAYMDELEKSRQWGTIAQVANEAVQIKGPYREEDDAERQEKIAAFIKSTISETPMDKDKQAETLRRNLIYPTGLENEYVDLLDLISVSYHKLNHAKGRLKEAKSSKSRIKTEREVFYWIRALNILESVLEYTETFRQVSEAG